MKSLTEKGILAARVVFGKLLRGRTMLPHAQEWLNDPALRKAHYQQLVVEYYDRITDIYRLGWGDRFHFAPFQGNESLEASLSALEEMLARNAGMGPSSRVLDVGCGVGGPACHIATFSGASVTGININAHQVAVASKRAASLECRDRVRFIEGDATSLPFPDATFDVVYSLEAICHIPDKVRLFGEIVRVLKPGGIFTGTDWAITRSAASEKEHADVEEICRRHALPYLASTDGIRADLGAAGFTLREFTDLAESGCPTRKWWQPLADRLDRPLFSGISWIREMMAGGNALLHTGRTGLFTPLCYWLASR